MDEIIISGKDLFSWYQETVFNAKKYNISIEELHYLLAELTELDALSIKLKNYQYRQQIFSQKSLSDLAKIWQLRTEKRYPIQYLVGKCYWRDLELKVTPDVLIPRPETELIIDIALEITKEYPQLKTGHWADLGTGSGAIALSLAKTFPQATIHAIDQSSNALSIATENAHNLGLKEKITFHHGSWFEPISHLKYTLSGILSNPPYIPSHIVPTLQPEVANHEPTSALDGGKDGLEDIKIIINQAPEYLQKNGLLIIEIMAGQAPQVCKILESNHQYHSIKTHADLAKIPRFIIAQKH
ncbi:peptide chain release factor N(5)-glutamine methyltransferase [Cyanobacterium stanieri LEGE 03274]|uniref:Release factor glutamine methyltransferase n=1 Tax=Cyanobacterium stanieri LEGE 03274 TaxID=1828756 RepID=A0ABR9V3I8_9CHRO|nr:peptide chain release factor N(5)-glutamine methyltransferase [Cyanobacterium stanieri]MBE9222455.1 peptide chain release factor N(5)-glutamine methyltransferase [Cyanobacterium stanieri LEGE 03274]